MRRSDLFQHTIFITINLQVLPYGALTLYQHEKPYDLD